MSIVKDLCESCPDLDLHIDVSLDGLDWNAADLVDRIAIPAEPDVFDRYTRQRRKAQVDYVQAQTIQNKKSLEEKDPVTRRKHLDELRRISEDVKLHKQFLYRAALIDSLNSANAVQ